MQLEVRFISLITAPHFLFSNPASMASHSKGKCKKALSRYFKRINIFRKDHSNGNSSRRRAGNYFTIKSDVSTTSAHVQFKATCLSSHQLLQEDAPLKTCNYPVVVRLGLEDQAMIALQQIPLFLREERRIVWHNETALELPCDFTENDRKSFCLKMYKRRNAIRVCDVNDLKRILHAYLIRKFVTNCYNV